MRTLVLPLKWAVAAVVMTACTSEADGQATVCSEDRFRDSWGTFPACCEDIGTDGHLYVFGKLEDGGALVIRRYLDRSGPPCVTGDGTTDCGCGTGASAACEDDDISCEYGQTGSSPPVTDPPSYTGFYGDENAAVFVPRGRDESTRCGADDNGATEGGTHPPHASAQEYTGRQTSYSGVTGVVPDAYSKCNEGVPGVVLALRASCTGDVTGTVSWGTLSVTCTSGTGETDVVEKAFFSELDASVQVEHSPTGWQGWAEACEGTGPCEVSIAGDTTVSGQFGG